MNAGAFAIYDRGKRSWGGLLFLALIGFASFFLGFAMETLTIKTLLLAVFGMLAAGILIIPDRWALRGMFFYVAVEGMAKMISGYNPVIHVGLDLLMVVLVGRCFLSVVTRHASVPEKKPPFL